MNKSELARTSGSSTSQLINMDSTTLELWSVIGTWVASIGTVAAVITSLWFALHQNSIKLKVSAGHRLVIIPGSQKTPEEYCSIRVVNIGFRPAKIISISWQVGRGKKKKVFYQVVGIQGYDDVPKMIQEGEEANFMIPFVYTNDVDDWIIRFPKELVGEGGSPDIIKSLTIHVHTSIGQSFKSKPELALVEKLQESYEANKNIGACTG